MAQTLICILCREKVFFTYKENNTYLHHLKTEHNIQHYSYLTLMLNVMDKIYVDSFSNMSRVSKPESLVCLLCRKISDFSDEEGDEYFNHIRNDHKIISNLKLIRSINLMDGDGLREIVKKFDETYNVDDGVNDEKNPTNGGDNKGVGSFEQNDTPNFAQNMKNDDEKMLIEEGSTFDDSMTTDHFEQEELLNGYKSKSQGYNAETVVQANIYSQSESSLDKSNYDSMDFTNSSFHSSFESNASLDSFDSRIKVEDSKNLSLYTDSRSPTKEMENENSKFSEAVQKELDKGNLSTTMDISYEKTHKKMKELTRMFMNGNSCTLCNRSFNNKSHLHEHIESLHNPSPVYFCHLCELPMTSSARHRQHKRKCSG